MNFCPEIVSTQQEEPRLVTLQVVLWSLQWVKLAPAFLHKRWSLGLCSTTSLLPLLDSRSPLAGFTPVTSLTRQHRIPFLKSSEKRRLFLANNTPLPWWNAVFNSIAFHPECCVFFISMQQPEYWHLKDYRNFREKKHLIGYARSGELSAAAVLFFLLRRCLFFAWSCCRSFTPLHTALFKLFALYVFNVFIFPLLMSSSVGKKKEANCCVPVTTWAVMG